MQVIIVTRSAAYCGNVNDHNGQNALGRIARGDMDNLPPTIEIRDVNVTVGGKSMPLVSVSPFHIITSSIEAVCIGGGW